MAETKQKKNIGEIFLANFVKTMIINSYASKNPETEIFQHEAQAFKLPAPEIKIQNRIQAPQKQFSQKIKSRDDRTFNQAAFFNPMPKEISQREKIGLGKIYQIISDPSVFSIECPGPEKNILVNRAGTIQASAMALTKDEIDLIMKEISDTTRIPLVSGVFKAAFRNLIITAVLSEFVGTRFLIQKKLPFARY